MEICATVIFFNHCPCNLESFIIRPFLTLSYIIENTFQILVLAPRRTSKTTAMTASESTSLLLTLMFLFVCFAFSNNS